MTKLKLRAKALARGADENYHRSTRQVYEAWDGSAWEDWVSNDYYLKIEGKSGTDEDQPPYEFPQQPGTPPVDFSFEKILQDPKYDEIELQPLVMADESKKQIEDLVNEGITAAALYVRVRKKMKWKSDKTKRLIWTFDNASKKLYTTFQEGEWVNMEKDPKFLYGGETNDISGLCLVYLTLRTEENETFPRNLDFTSLRCSTLDGVHRESSLRGATLTHTKFVGKSRLNRADLTSTMCAGAHLRFNERTKDKLYMVWPNFENAGFVVDATFKIEKKSGGGATPNPNPNPVDLHEASSIYQALFTKRKKLQNCKNEMQYVVDELERLSRYEVKKDNWHEIVDSWMALFKLELKTKTAINVQKKLFELDDSKQILEIGRFFFFWFDPKPHHGLLLKLKKHVANSLLGNEEYYKDKEMLMDEISNIDEIFWYKDQTVTSMQYVFLSFLFFIVSIFSDFVKSYMTKLLKQELKIQDGMTKQLDEIIGIMEEFQNSYNDTYI